MPEKSSSHSYIKDIYGSAATFEYVAQTVGIPKDVKGLFFVDIGSSVSPVVKRLNEMGGYAIGIDYKYTSLKTLVTSVEPSFTNPNRWNFPITRHIPSYLRGETKQDNSNKPSNPLTRLLYWIVESKNDYATWGDRASYLRQSERAYKEFLIDYQSKSRQGIYVAGRSERLPLTDDIADMVYSVASLSIFVIRDRQSFIDSMQEAIRITKPGGLIAIDPWFTQDNQVWTPTMLNNGENFLSLLDSKKIPYQISPKLQRENGGCLHIQKPE